MLQRYPISPEDCLILLAIRKTHTLREAARLLDCDPGGLLRKVQRIAADHDLLRKKNGKWSLTERGIPLVGWAQETILSQKRILHSERVLRIASTSWLTERLLIPQSGRLAKLLKEPTEIQFLVPDQGFERSLAEGDSEFAIACHPPEDPAIAHRQLSDEAWVAVTSRSIVKKRPSMASLSSLPFIRHHGLNPDTVLPASIQARTRAMVSADSLIGVRAAVLAGLGWSYVPKILVEREVREGQLICLESNLKMGRRVCLWWLRESAAARRRTAVLEEWLRAALKP